MADFAFSDDRELQQLNEKVLEDPEKFESWEALVRAAEAQEGGLHRNSSPGAIASTRDTYDRFLARFPLFFGYWKKYADLEFAIAGTEAAEMVYERGVASVGTSVDLWANYCGFKIDTSHDPDVIRELFDRGAESVGLDFLAHPFWDKYIEFEERNEAPDRIFAILGRIIHIPLHQYARYFEKYRNMAKTRPVTEIAPPQTINQHQEAIFREGGPKQKSPQDVEQELRARIDAYHMGIFHHTQAETTKRWTYESEIKRPYYHVTELDDAQLENWRKYLDFEQDEGNYLRIKFLYERCVVTAANYQEFWLRYARWMHAQGNKVEEVRNIYQRASCTFVPIAMPDIRLFYARFEESQGRADVAVAIYEAVLMHLPTDSEAILSLVNAQRRQYGIELAIDSVKKYLSVIDRTTTTRGKLASELARLSYRQSGNPDDGRDVFESYKEQLGDNPHFWIAYFRFEVNRGLSGNDETANYARVKAVYDSLRQARIPDDAIKDASWRYQAYLKSYGGKNAMKESLMLDAEVYGPGDPATRVARSGDPKADATAANKLAGQPGGAGGVPGGTNGMQR